MTAVLLFETNLQLGLQSWLMYAPGPSHSCALRFLKAINCYPISWCHNLNLVLYMTEKSFTPGRRISSSSSWLNSPITPTKLKSNKELQKQLDYFELLTSRSHHPYKMLVLLLTFHRGNVLFCTWNPSYSFRTFFCNLTESMVEWYSRTICHK